MKKVLPKSIGPYRIRALLGEGGMGIVYLAEQERPVRREVALKVIKLGMDTKEVVARFEAERQAQALMNHTNIAKALFAGATEDGRPFFVMERVAGIPITEYCDQHRLGIRQRLELFIRTCHGIHHAHQKGIIHRDIKPSNVLVTQEDGRSVPKVIDFGVAKSVIPRLTEKTLYTQAGTPIGTPEYMSPEQAESGGLDVDTGTDVYSLGVLLYELLVGALPLNLRGLSFARMQQAISEEDPPKLATRLSSLGDRATDIAGRRQTDPRSLSKRLGGELEWITRKAIDKDRARRYASASELAADIERYLRNEPIQARPLSTRYLLRKAVTRYKAPLAVAAALLVLLVGFAAAMALQARRIAREAERANREAATAEQVSAFMEELFTVSDPGEARGNTVTAREILDAGAERIETELADQPLVQARLMHTMGYVYDGLGLYDLAASLLEKAVSIREAELGENHLDMAASLGRLANVYRRAGRFEEAERCDLRVLDIRENALGPDHLEVAKVWNDLALARWKMGKYDQAELHLQRALEIKERVLGPDDPSVAVSLTDLGNIYREIGRNSEAESLYDRALPILEKALGPNHLKLARTLNNLALIHASMGRYAEAEPLFERTLAIRQEALGPHHPFVTGTQNNLAMLYTITGRHVEAESIYRQALRAQEEELGRHPDVASTLTNLGNLYLEGDRYLEAESLFERATAIREEKLGSDHPHVAWSLHGLANVYRQTSRLAEAEPLYDRALAIREKVGANHPNVAWTLHDLAQLYVSQGKLAEAEVAYRRTLGIREAFFGPNHSQVAATLEAYAALLRALSRDEEAEEMESRGLTMMRQLDP